MKNYGIETNWGGRGTVYYNVGMYNSIEEAFHEAIKNYKWFANDPNIEDIKELTA